MKSILYSMVAALFLFTACDKESINGTEEVSLEIIKALAEKYPTASNISWHTKGGYTVASFEQNSGNSKAWFDRNAVWYLTETDIAFPALPEAVKKSFSSGAYASWTVEEVDMIQRQNMETLYVIEVDQGSQEAELYYSADGILVKSLVDADSDYGYEDLISGQLPSFIKSYLTTNYPEARILEADYEEGFYDVEILDGNVCRELLFNQTGTWLRTKTEDLSLNEVPSPVTKALQVSVYAAYRVDDVDFYVTPARKYYLFELKSANGDVKVEITPEGVLTIANSGANDPDEDNEYNSISLNQACKDFISSSYPGAAIREVEYDDGYLSVEIYHESREKEVRFNASNKWVDTRWDVRRAELPAGVLAAVASSPYASYDIDDIEYVKNSLNEWFEIDMEKGNTSVVLRIIPDGTILK